MKKYLIVSLILGLFTACSGFISDDEDYTFTDYFEPLRYDKENGGYMIAGNGNTKFTIFDFTLSDTKNSKEQIVKAKEPLVSYWKIGRNPLGMKPVYDKCGNEPSLYKDFNYKDGSELAKEETIEFKNYMKARRKWIDCIDDLPSEYAKDVIKTFNSQTTYKYYYAKMPENHLVHYPKKSELHFRWNISNYIGGVNDLAIEAVPEVYKNNLDKLRGHKCHKWGASSNHTCYDLPNGDKNIYYALREELYKEVNGEKVEPNSYLMDVRVSEPLNWIEIDGIEINKDIYEYLNKVCEKIELCHLNDYTGALTQEQKEYIKKNEWSTDEVWKEKPQKEDNGSSNPWR